MSQHYNVLMVELDRDLGGSVISTLALAQELQKLGNKVTIVIPKYNSWEHLISDYGIEYISVDAWPAVKKKSDPITLKKRVIKVYKDFVNFLAEGKIERFIVKNQIDIVHIATLNYECGARAAKICNRHLVWHIREFLEEDHGTEWIDKKHSCQIINSSDAIITISDSIYHKYKHILNPTRMHRVYNGIDFDKYYAKRDLFINRKIMCAIFGRVSEGKGQKEFILAAKKCDQELFEFHIVGGGNTDTFNTEGFSNIIFDGHIDNPEKIMKHMDIICVCSKNEAFGRVTVEAMASGSLVIGADTGGTIELIQDGKTGLLYRQGDSDDLANKIKWVTENKDNAKNIANYGQNHVKKMFTAKKNAKEVYDIYSKLS